MSYDFKKEYSRLREPEILTVPRMNYVSVNGKGNPNEECGEYKAAIKILYAISYTLKMSMKMDYVIDGFYDYVVPPLESFWEWNAYEKKPDKSSIKWIAVIRLPDFIREENFDWAVEKASLKKKLDCSAAKFLTIDEGMCVQAMHIGAFDDEANTIALMDKYIHERGFENDINTQRLHHEIYLSDLRKVPTEKLKTVIRHPITR